LLAATVRKSPSGKAAMDVKKIVAQVRRFRRQGYATELNEANEHAGCIAAPVIDAAGRCIAALSVVVPEQRLARPNREHLIVSVIKAAEKLSRRIGGPRAV
jgi:DNA-binding IclR family transcriptional regulator